MTKNEEYLGLNTAQDRFDSHSKEAIKTVKEQIEPICKELYSLVKRWTDKAEIDVRYQGITIVTKEPYNKMGRILIWVGSGKGERKENPYWGDEFQKENKKVFQWYWHQDTGKWEGSLEEVDDDYLFVPGEWVKTLPTILALKRYEIARARAKQLGLATEEAAANGTV